MLRRSVNICGALLCIISFAQLSYAQCKKAKAHDVPHGANEYILLSERVFGRIHGKIFFPNYRVEAGREPARDIVVEIYKHRGGDTSAEANDTLRTKKRLAACLTGADGRFSFTGLKHGRYLLRAGTRARDQFNEVNVILTLSPGNRRRSLKGLEIVLTPGS